MHYTVCHNYYSTVSIKILTEDDDGDDGLDNGGSGGGSGGGGGGRNWVIGWVLSHTGTADGLVEWLHKFTLLELLMEEDWNETERLFMLSVAPMYGAPLLVGTTLPLLVFDDISIICCWGIPDGYWITPG